MHSIGFEDCVDDFFFFLIYIFLNHHRDSYASSSRDFFFLIAGWIEGFQDCVHDCCCFLT